ncbi:MAG TPA: helix-turn-helix transcriptional regulator [candidate division Zixibacteria bacterium]|jgi:ribosome-binding protein aMBF1 (putative translation factor)
MTARKPQSKTLKYLYDRYIGPDPKARARLEQERVNMDIAQAIYDLRTKAGLTQRELAKMVGTSASVICQLEDSDYQGHSLSMLQRIAAALNCRVDVRIRPLFRRKVMDPAS